jgi:hypothetical protein
MWCVLRRCWLVGHTRTLALEPFEVGPATTAS